MGSLEEIEGTGPAIKLMVALHVGVPAFKDEGPVPPRMVVEITLVVGTEPVMESNCKNSKIDHPPLDVGTFGVAEFFAPGNHPLAFLRALMASRISF